VLGRLNVPAEQGKVVFETGAIVEFASEPMLRADGPLGVEVSFCPDCELEETTVEVKLNKITKPKKDKEAMHEIAHLTYPGTALPVLEALFQVSLLPTNVAQPGNEGNTHG
jgi:hypothetical protein